MKLIRTIISFAAVIVLSTMTVSAQKYVPKERWPYIYQEFVEGEVVSTSGEIQKALYNIPVTTNRVHYIKDGVVMELPILSLSSITIGSDTYVVKYGSIYKVMASSDNGYALQLTKPDYDKMSSANIGYGISSATASVQNITTLLDDSSAELLNKRYETLQDLNGQGKEIPLRVTTHIFVNGMVIDATQSDVVKQSGLEKSVVTDFIKKNKIKWKDGNSLITLVDFIASQK